ncbi:protein kinase, putative, partial [Bodo saltans]
MQQFGRRLLFVIVLYCVMEAWQLFTMPVSAALTANQCSDYDMLPQSCLSLYLQTNATCGYSYNTRRCVNCSQASVDTCKLVTPGINNTNNIALNNNTNNNNTLYLDACMYNPAIGTCVASGFNCNNYTATTCTAAPFTTQSNTFGQCQWSGSTCFSCSALSGGACARPRCMLYNNVCMSTTNLCFQNFSTNQSHCDTTLGCFYDITRKLCLSCAMYTSKAACDNLSPTHVCRWNSVNGICSSTTDCTTYSLGTCPADHCVVDDSSECDNPQRLCSAFTTERVCRSYSDRFQCSWILNSCTTCLQLPNTSCASIPKDCVWHASLKLCLPFSSGGSSPSGAGSSPDVTIDVPVNSLTSTGTILLITLPIAAGVVVVIASIRMFLRFRARKQKLREAELTYAENMAMVSPNTLPGQSKGSMQILLPAHELLPPRGTSDLALQAPALFQEGHIQRLKLLGRGANGSVYSCMMPDGTLIAMKEILLPHGQSENEEFVGGIMNEVSIVCSFDHPNVVRFFGSALEKEEHRLTIFMEMVPNGSLASVVRSMQEPMKEDVARVYVRQLVSALDYIHGRGVVHRDLKCDNLLLTSEGWIKLTDFGASKLVGVDSMATHAAQTMVGTPFFMAPEILLGGDEGGDTAGYGRRADIWSLGITVLEMMHCGKVPWPDFPSAGAALMYVAAQDSCPIIPDHLSDIAKDFISKCCHRDPMQRLSAP